MIQKIAIPVLVLALLAPLSAFQGPYSVGNGVTAPKVISRVQAVYTAEAKQAKIQGTVTMKVVVDRSGIPRDIHVIKPLEPTLDRSAVEAVRQWTFEPGKKDGQAVDVIAAIEMNFRLN